MLTRTEEILLLSVARLQDEAFGLTIRKDVEAVTGKRYSVGGIYVPLERLVKQGLLKTESEKGSADRMGRPRKRFVITSAGVAALSDVRALQASMWKGLPDVLADRLRKSVASS